MHNCDMQRLCDRAGSFFFVSSSGGLNALHIMRVKFEGLLVFQCHLRAWLCERGSDTRHDGIEARIAVRKLDVSMDVI